MTVGPFAVLTGPCRIGDGVWIGPHTTIGTPPEIRGVPHPPVAEQVDSNRPGITIGAGTIIREYNHSSDPMAVAEATMHFAFEFFTKLGVEFWCWHDRDIAPEAGAAEGGLAETNRRLDRIVGLAKKLQRDTGMKVLWGTTNMFSHRRFMAGAATNPSPEVFAYAAAQVKKAMELKLLD